MVGWHKLAMGFVSMATAAHLKNESVTKAKKLKSMTTLHLVYYLPKKEEAYVRVSSGWSHTHTHTGYPVREKSSPLAAGRMFHAVGRSAETIISALASRYC